MVGLVGCIDVAATRVNRDRLNTGVRGIEKNLLWRLPEVWE